jgi:hypothetical protein
MICQRLQRKSGQYLRLDVERLGSFRTYTPGCQEDIDQYKGNLSIEKKTFLEIFAVDAGDIDVCIFVYIGHVSRLQAPTFTILNYAKAVDPIMRNLKSSTSLHGVSEGQWE